jgi:EAL domain-containing protein (putative c-di-GMP-specific phosphodiesterase class I)
VTGGTRCPACGRQLPDGDRPHGGRKARYCSGACKAKACRARQQAGQPADTQALPPADRHARIIEIRQQVSELASDMADAASSQQPLFSSPSAARRRTRPAETARTLHRLIAELAAHAVAAAVTERQAPGGPMQTMPLLDEASTGG